MTSRVDKARQNAERAYRQPLETVTKAAQERSKAREALDAAETTFRLALAACRPFYTWQEIADAAGISHQGVQWLVKKYHPTTTEGDPDNGDVT